MSSVKTYRAAVLGASGTGKSTLFRWGIVAQQPCAWVLDPYWEHRKPHGGHLFRPAPGERDVRAGGRYFEDAQRLAYAAAQTGAVTLCIDEANSCVRRGQQGPPSISEICHEGRHLPHGNPTGVGIVLVARRPAELPPDWLSQLEHIFLFRVVNPRDLEWATASGFAPRAVRKLRRGQFFHLRPDGQPPHLHAHMFAACPGDDEVTDGPVPDGSAV